ncbi:MAG: ComEC/Rec2 family competence protein, partial [Nocardioidaceae bacterium]
DLPGAAVPWPATPLNLVLLTVACLVVVLVLPWLLPRRGWSLAVAALGALVVLQPAGAIGWPPPGWVMVACDVGQGDALVLNAGGGAAMVVDTGPDPTAIDGCLDRLEVDVVPLVLLTHLHADHAAGLAGVGEGRPVAELEVGPLDSPPDQFRDALRWAGRWRVPVRRAVYGERRRLGQLSWRVVGPVDGSATALAVDGTEGSESGAENNASLVLAVRTRGARLLLTGDVEPEGQQALLGAHPNLRADVLKVPHHGSRYQDEEFLTSVGADVAIVSVGADNDYGHPATEVLRLLELVGTDAYRTDLSGDVAVVVDHSSLSVETQD